MESSAAVADSWLLLGESRAGANTFGRSPKMRHRRAWLILAVLLSLSAAGALFAALPSCNQPNPPALCGGGTAAGVKTTPDIMTGDCGGAQGTCPESRYSPSQARN
jgi:hypothetical protein